MASLTRLLPPPSEEKSSDDARADQEKRSRLGDRDRSGDRIAAKNTPAVDREGSAEGPGCQEAQVEVARPWLARSAQESKKRGQIRIQGIDVGRELHLE